MIRWEFKIVPCLAGGNASATCLKRLVTRFADVQWPVPLSFHSMFKAQYEYPDIIIIIFIIRLQSRLDWVIFLFLLLVPRYWFTCKIDNNLT